MGSRWTPLSGVVFAALLFIGFDVLLIDTPGEASSDQKIASSYAHSGDYNKVIAGKAVILVSLPFFLWFAGLLRSRVRLAEGATGHLSATGFGAAVACATLITASSVVQTTIASTIGFSSKFKHGPLDPQLVRLLNNMGYSLLVGGLFSAAVLVAATSLVVRRLRLWPRWLSTGGLVVAALLIPTAAIAPVGVILFALWTVAASVSLVRSASAAGGPGDTSDKGR